jgi:hypothetical protein
VLQLGLEADHVPQRAQGVVLAQLDDGVGLDQRVARIGQADRLHRTVAQGLAAALGHHLDRQAAVEIGDVLPLLELGLGAFEQGVDEGLVLGLVHGQVDIGRRVAAGAFLVVARLAPGDVHVDRLDMDDRGDGVEERQLAFARQLQDRVGQGRRGEGAGGHHDAVPVGGRQAGDFLALDGDQRMGFQAAGDLGREAVAIDGQGAAGGHLVLVGGRHDQAVAAAHLGVQQAHGVELPVVRAERVGAHHLGQTVGMVGVRAHFCWPYRFAA